MSRATLILNSELVRAKAKRWIDGLPHGTRVEFKAPKRTLPQNDLLWVLLTKVSQQLEWHGQRYTPDDWKDFMMHQLRKAEWMPAENGGLVPIGMRTSDLSVSEMSDLIEVIHSFCARHGVSIDD